MGKVKRDNVVPYWIGHYIGWDYKEMARGWSSEADCWGLTRVVLAEQLGIATPSLVNNYNGHKDVSAISETIIRESTKWKPVLTDEQQLGDVIILQKRNKPIHVALVVSPNTMLYIEHGEKSRLVRFKASGKNVWGIFRYKNPLSDY